MVAIRVPDGHDDGVTRQQLAGSGFGTTTANEEQKLFVVQSLRVKRRWFAEDHEARPSLGPFVGRNTGT
jgi:hypothetical protein